MSINPMLTVFSNPILMEVDILRLTHPENPVTSMEVDILRLTHPENPATSM